MKTMILALAALGLAAPAAAQEATVRVHSLDGAFDTKIDDRNAEPLYAGKVGYIDQVKNPWRTVSQGKWAREIDPALAKSNFSLSASADYDSDGKADTAQLYTNGQQIAVIVKFGAAKPPLVIYKADGVAAGTELMGKGNRFLLSVPEVGYRVLALHKGKPVSVAVGD